MPGQRAPRVVIAEVESKDEARSLVVLACRAVARVIGLNKFSMEELGGIETRHELTSAE